jgi:CRP/FNR family transcriptional regulator
MARSREDPRVLELAARIQRAPLFADLGQAGCREVAAAGAFRRLRKGEVLWRRGAHAYEVAFVWEGALGVVREQMATESGAQVGYRVVPINDTIGLSNAIGRIPCSVDVVAREASRVVLFPGDALRALVPRYPELAFRAIAQLGDLVATLSDEIERLHTGSLEERIVARLRQLARGRREVLITHEALASQVAARRESVTRALGELAERGLVTLGRGRIQVHA